MSNRFNGSADELRMLYVDTLATAFDALAYAEALGFYVTPQDEEDAMKYTNSIIGETH